MNKQTKALPDDLEFAYQRGYRAGVHSMKPAQEPVAWIKEYELLVIKSHKKIGATNWNTNLGLKSEPDDVPLYTHPSPSWQGLSDDEIENVLNREEYDERVDLIHLSRAIEQALKEKNT